ncbi:hypothetical protein [Roseivivax halodurans]|uniref:hypothetical protein n=1 Tax=Roseivivax halodurans TaxID=93683 RepID=UPI0012FB3D8C|nr:hypothetical protein [Roseivivax halodurans]
MTKLVDVMLQYGIGGWSHFAIEASLTGFEPLGLEGEARFCIPAIIVFPGSQ